MMMLGLAPVDVGDKVYSITPSAMSVGVVTSLPGFTLGADSLSVMNNSGAVYGSTAKVFGRTGTYVSSGTEHTEAMFETKASGRDVVVTTWARGGTFYLRCNKQMGVGIRISWSGDTANGEMRILYCTNIPDTFAEFYPGHSIGGVELLYTDNLASYVTGWNPSSTEGDEFEFSLIANVLTVKWNNQTIYTSDIFFFALNYGTVLYVAGGVSGALRDTTITFKASEPTYTDYDNKVLDFRDWGLKSSNTTGSMSAGSTTLTVASAAGFSVGDRVIVGTGGESGAGLRGTVGVGGTWPRDRYANVASLPDPVTYDGDFVYVEDEESVYTKSDPGSGVVWAEWTNYILSDAARARAHWFTTSLLPRALRATITNIAGTTITLDTASVEATTNAEVWVDCSWIVPHLMPNTRFEFANTNAITNQGWNVRYPTGTFCIPSETKFPYTLGWTFRGTSKEETIIYAPKGTAPPTLVFCGGDYTVSHMKAKGWAGAHYFCHTAEAFWPSDANHSFCTAVAWLANRNFQDLEIENTWGGVFLGNSFNSSISRCVGRQTNGNLQQYRSWFFQASYNDANSWIEDCEYIATEVGTAFEIFQANGGGMRRCTSTQGVVASNSSGGGFLIDEMVISIDYRYLPTELNWLSPSGPAMNINTNIGGGAENPGIIAEGGTIRNPTITVVKADDGSMGSAININSGAVNITVEGTHPAKPGQGVLTMSDYEAGDVGRGACGILADPVGTVVRGIRVIGASESFGTFGNISLRNADGIVENCVAETIGIFNGTSYDDQQGTNGNITNAEYEAL